LRKNLLRLHHGEKRQQSDAEADERLHEVSIFDVAREGRRSYHTKLEAAFADHRVAD
jgi:hypothetical protein